MRKYELMTIFPLDEEKSKKGTEDVRKVMTDFGAEITEEKLFGDRDLCYEIAKNKKGRFVLFNIKVNPAKVIDIDRQFKLQKDLLKFLFVRVDE